LKLTLFLGIILTAGVCFLFLGSLGTTINICLSIPTSLIGTFFVLRYGVQLLGLEPFTINMMTLLGLSLSVGVVVDDAILVLENIYRHREMGKPKREAALPVAFMKGTIGKFFFQFGVTVSVAVFFSLISALTLTPMLCAFFLNLHQRVPTRPLTFGTPLALVIGLLVMLTGVSIRLLALLFPDVGPWGWWPASLGSLVLGDTLPGPAVLQGLVWWWVGVSAAEFALGFLVTRFGNMGYWAVDRYFLEPLLLRPTEWVLTRITDSYAWLLGWSLRHWGIVLGQGAAFILIAFVFIYFDLLGRELVPSEDQSRFIVHLVCPVSSSIDDIDHLIQECERKLQARHDVTSFLTTVATEQGQLMNEVDIFVQLVPRAHRTLSQHKIMGELRDDLDSIPDIRVVMRDQSTEGFTAQRGDPVDFAIRGDWERLPDFYRKIREEMLQSGVFVDMDSNYRPGMQEVRILPNRDKLAMVNMSMSHLANSLNLHFASQRIAKYTEGGRRYDIRMRLLRNQRTSPSLMESLLLRSGENRLVPLKDVASVQLVSTLPVVNRYNHQRMIEITASPAPGYSQGEAIAKAQEIAVKVLPPQEFSVAELGNAQAMRETIDSLIFALLLGIIIAYMILGVQFNSFVHPLTVLLAMPFAATGALVTLWLTGDTLNMMSMIGLILLMGLVKKNSIILVDYTNQLREEGLGVTEAVLKACPIRLRPILMTSVATVAGAIPAAIGWGPGAETRAPMARGIIGGIILSTLVTLVLVPVFYVIIERLRNFCRSRLLVPATPPAPEVGYTKPPSKVQETLAK
jgi:multidrug efflux pump subunit AcrB